MELLSWKKFYVCSGCGLTVKPCDGAAYPKGGGQGLDRFGLRVCLRGSLPLPSLRLVGPLHIEGEALGSLGLPLLFFLCLSPSFQEAQQCSWGGWAFRNSVPTRALGPVACD